VSSFSRLPAHRLPHGNFRFHALPAVERPDPPLESASVRRSESGVAGSRGRRVVDRSEPKTTTATTATTAAAVMRALDAAVQLHAGLPQPRGVGPLGLALEDLARTGALDPAAVADLRRAGAAARAAAAPPKAPPPPRTRRTELTRPTRWRAADLDALDADVQAALRDADALLGDGDG
jgi:hypothetical protein